MAGVVLAARETDMITISYTSSVKVLAGHRSVTITAKAERISAGMAQVVEVLAIDGEAPRYGMSRTGAARQQYDGRYVARREVGSRKRLSACVVTEESA
jgi:hypothetical protein